jgi:murein DD-endopeptidase MepM/ murein hydrolase activator NlpD
VTTYGHVASIHVYKGQPVQKGDVIASSGASGDVAVPQLHFEVRKNGSAENPMTILASR